METLPRELKCEIARFFDIADIYSVLLTGNHEWHSILYEAARPITNIRQYKQAIVAKDNLSLRLSRYRRDDWFSYSLSKGIQYDNRSLVHWLITHLLARNGSKPAGEDAGFYEKCIYKSRRYQRFALYPILNVMMTLRPAPLYNVCIIYGRCAAGDTAVIDELGTSGLFIERLYTEAAYGGNDNILDTVRYLYSMDYKGLALGYAKAGKLKELLPVIEKLGLAMDYQYWFTVGECLMIAARKNYDHIIAELSSRNTGDYLFDRSLIAIGAGRLEILKLIVHQVNSGNYPLLLSCCEDNATLELVQYIVNLCPDKSSKDFLEEASHCRDTAAGNGFTDIVAYLTPLIGEFVPSDTKSGEDWD